jgi:type II secretory pathway component GspD/PulD (secretin)
VTSGGVNVPSIDTREISTQVLVNDGQTVVLGGILETKSVAMRQGALHRRRAGARPPLQATRRTNNKDELLIFVTPRSCTKGLTFTDHRLNWRGGDSAPVEHASCECESLWVVGDNAKL